MTAGTAVQASTLTLDLVAEDAEWPSGVLALADTIPDAILALTGLEGGQHTATVMIADDDRVKALNSQFRGKDAATNVLSFPSPIAAFETDEPQYLGDVVLAAQTVALEAAAQSKAVDAHTIHLIVHGILHLLGYDHETDADAAEMEALEVRILDRLGLSDPYREELHGSH